MIRHVNGFVIYGAVLAASLVLFWYVPGIDLSVSNLFYDPRHGFPLAAWPPMHAVAGSIRWITWAILLVIAVGAAWLRLAGRPFWRFDRNALIFVVAAVVIGPGILVNTVLKDHWGRARPFQVEEFGGTHQFTPAPIPADQCTRNCAFVSGHAALGFSLIAFAFLLPAGMRRNQAIAAALAFGALIGLGRIAAGHHFLSDVVDAGLLVVATTWLLHRWLVVHDGATPVIAYVNRLRETQNGRRVLWVAAFLLTEIVAMIWLDRPIADFFHDDGSALQPFFLTVQNFGLGYPWLVLSGLAFIFLRWGGEWQQLRRWKPSMRAMAFIPGFIFAAVGAAGLIADALKILIGRTRPKLLFADGTYDLTWFGWQADHWSFPSGHAATAAALMTALWCLWPRPVWLYVAGAALVAASRVITGQHYLSDVIAGAAVGGVVTRLVAMWLLRPRGEIIPPAAATPDAAPTSPAV